MSAADEYDAVVIGAGVAGLAALHHLRERGLRVRAFDAADDVGGTWAANAWPGARLSTEGPVYQYLFSEELFRDWGWSERFPAGYEVLRWLRFVADRLDLHRDLQLRTRVLAAHHDAATGRWSVHLEGGATVGARFVVACTGTLSAPREDAVPGRGDFAGPVVHTGRWPARGLGRDELAGRRVGVVGTGPSGIQLAQTLAGRVAHLTVFTRTPTDVLPMSNPVYGWPEREAYRARLDELRATLPRTSTGSDREPAYTWGDHTPEGRDAILEQLYDDGSLALWTAGFRELATDADVAAEVSRFVRARMRARIADPRHAELLVPTDHLFGTRHVALESGYLEIFARDDVSLVGVRDVPIARLRAAGVELADGTVHELDVVALATGHDGLGALSRIDVRGRRGRPLVEAGDVRTTLGLAVHGFPGLFLAGGPLAPGPGLAVATTTLEHQVAWIARAIADLDAAGASTIEPTAEGEAAWVAHHDAVAARTLAASGDEWWVGPGGRLLLHPDAGAHRARCEDEAAAGYPSFTRR